MYEEETVYCEPGRGSLVPPATLSLAVSRIHTCAHTSSRILKARLSHTHTHPLSCTHWHKHPVGASLHFSASHTSTNIFWAPLSLFLSLPPPHTLSHTSVNILWAPLLDGKQTIVSHSHTLSHTHILSPTPTHTGTNVSWHHLWTPNKALSLSYTHSLSFLHTLILSLFTRTPAQTSCGHHSWT